MTTLFLTVLLQILPPNEERIVQEVSRECSLSQDQSVLLRAIRRSENGGRGIEFGVDRPRAKRYKYRGSSTDSFRCQARWAAGTIKKRYTGDLDAFAEVWHPQDVETWKRNVRFFIRKQKGELDAKKKEERSGGSYGP